jgi:hypothetical protein
MTKDIIHYATQLIQAYTSEDGSYAAPSIDFLQAINSELGDKRIDFTSPTYCYTKFNVSVINFSMAFRDNESLKSMIKDATAFQKSDIIETHFEDQNGFFYSND